MNVKVKRIVKVLRQILTSWSFCGAHVVLDRKTLPAFNLASSYSMLNLERDIF